MAQFRFESYYIRNARQNKRRRSTKADNHVEENYYWITLDMDFEALIRRFRILFSCFGISPFNLFVESVNGRRTKFVDIFPAIFYLVFIIGLIGGVIGYRYQSIAFRRKIAISFVLACIRISSEVLLQLVIIGQAIVFRQRMKILCRTYDSIQKYMKTRMGHNVDFGVFQKKLVILFFTVFFPHLATLIIRRTIVNRSNFYTTFSNILAIFYLLSSLAQFYVAIHIELLRFFLTLMTQWLRKQVKASLCEQKDLWKVEQLNNYSKLLQLKFIHFKLWKLSTNINRIFGWSLAAILLRNSIEIAYGIYWAFFYYVVGGPFLYRFREFTQKYRLTDQIRNSHGYIHLYTISQE